MIYLLLMLLCKLQNALQTTIDYINIEITLGMENG